MFEVWHITYNEGMRTVSHRYEEAVQLTTKHGVLEVRNQGGAVTLRTGARLIRSTRRNVRLAAVVLIVGGFAQTFTSLWGWVVLTLGVIGFLAGPKLIKQASLAFIDESTDILSLLQGGISVPCSGKTGIVATYETQGWDPRNVITLVCKGDAKHVALIFSGANEAITEAACRVLSCLLDVPATYTTQFETVVDCTA
jgi:hypothetical protein